MVSGAGSPPRVTLVGLGRMGMPMCTNLVRAGYPVTAADQRPETQAVAEAVGAVWASTSAQAAARADVVITMLSGSPEVHEVMHGTGGVLDAMRAGACWIDMGSTSPTAGLVIAEAARARRIDVLDAPVGGGPAAAAAGTLGLYVGGDGELLDAHRDLLHAVADPEHIAHMGPNGTGYTTKLLVNLLWFGQAVATGEALLLARRAGIDLDTMQQALAGSAAGGVFIRRDVPALLRGDYLRTFGIDRCYEQLATISTLAHENGVPFEVSDLVTRIHARAVEHFGAQDGELLAVALLEQEAGFFLRSPDR